MYPLKYRRLFPHVSQWETDFLGPMTSWDWRNTCNTSLASICFWLQSPGHFLRAWTDHRYLLIIYIYIYIQTSVYLCERRICRSFNTDHCCLQCFLFICLFMRRNTITISSNYVCFCYHDDKNFDSAFFFFLLPSSGCFMLNKFQTQSPSIKTHFITQTVFFDYNL